MNKDEIRPIYLELQGYMSQAPSESTATLFDASIWEQYNQAIDELNEVTGKNYDRFKPNVRTDPMRDPRPAIRTSSYRQKLGGLIARLHGEYFQDESPPFGGTPSTVIQQTQSQEQSVQIQILLDIQSKIDEKLPEYEEGSEEKTFLEKVKSSLKSVRNVTDLVRLILQTAKDVGLSIDKVSELFS